MRITDKLVSVSYLFLILITMLRKCVNPNPNQ